MHIWTRYRGLRVEVQLRTLLQHRWAMLVESITALAGTDYKSGEGSAEVHSWLRLLSQSYAYDEAGIAASREFKSGLADAGAVALSTIVGGITQVEGSHG